MSNKITRYLLPNSLDLACFANHEQSLRAMGEHQARLHVAEIAKLFGEALKLQLPPSIRKAARSSSSRGGKNAEDVTMGNPQPSS